ncbi:MAG: hypothetical protein LBC89_01205 [Bacteroidales bacterium]|jgi:tetratricopeptide (TPR) repeat protein|nr:hypothetical protein [Bacteroidales bacterium]
MKKTALLLALIVAVATLVAQNFKTEADSIECATNTSIYQEFYKQQNYGDAYEPWLILYAKYPFSHKNVFIRGANILKFKIAQASKETAPVVRVAGTSANNAYKVYASAAKTYNAAVKAKATQSELDKLKAEFDAAVVEKDRTADEYEKASELQAIAINKYVDQLLEMWDVRATNFGEKGYCLYKKARDMQIYRKKETNTIYNVFKEAMAACEEENDWKELTTPFFYFESAMNAEKDSIISKEEVLEAYDKASTILEELYTKNQGDTNLIAAINQLDVAFLPYASCEEIIPIYEKKFEANKTSADFLRKVCKVLDKKECTNSELFFKSTEALHGVEPSAQTAYLMAIMCDSKKMFNKVVEYLTPETIVTMPTNLAKERAYLLAAKAYSSLNQYSKGRAAAYEALKINPNVGLAYILIGNMYAASAASCGDDPQVGKKAAYWVAVDKYMKAKTIDPNVAETADNLINTYRKHFPENNDIFMMGLKVGDTYTVGCWIQEATIIRAR